MKRRFQMERCFCNRECWAALPHRSMKGQQSWPPTGDPLLGKPSLLKGIDSYAWAAAKINESLQIQKKVSHRRAFTRTFARLNGKGNSHRDGKKCKRLHRLTALPIWIAPPARVQVETSWPTDTKHS